MTENGTNSVTPLRSPPPAESRPSALLRRIPLWSLFAVAVLAMALVVVFSVRQAGSTNDATDNASRSAAVAETVKSNAAPLAGQVATVCGQGNAAARQLAASGACTQAQKVISVVQQPIPGPSGKPGPGPTDAQVQRFVDAFFATHPLPPGQLPPVSEVAGLVAGYLQVHPPANGQNATPDMVATAVMDYCDARNGCAGPQGQTGPGASDAQVFGQVQAFCAGPTNPCQGPPGVKGDTGDTGAKGDTGATGPPPATYTVQVPGLTGSTTETCTRTGQPGDTDANPDYACQ